MKFLKIAGGVALGAFALVCWVILGSGFNKLMASGFDGADWALFAVTFPLAVVSTAGAIVLIANALKSKTVRASPTAD